MRIDAHERLQLLGSGSTQLIAHELVAALQCSKNPHMESGPRIERADRVPQRQRSQLQTHDVERLALKKDTEFSNDYRDGRLCAPWHQAQNHRPVRPRWLRCRGGCPFLAQPLA